MVSVLVRLFPPFAWWIEEQVFWSVVVGDVDGAMEAWSLTLLFFFFFFLFLFPAGVVPPFSPGLRRWLRNI